MSVSVKLQLIEQVTYVLPTGISAQMMSRITGTVLIIIGERHDRPTESLSKLNVGLNLKFNKKVRVACDHL